MLKNNYKKPLLKGIVNKTTLTINPELTSAEKSSTLDKLSKAIALGYDSCIVTNVGVFATKRL